MSTCEEYVKTAGGLATCGRPLDDRGQCDRASDHVDPETGEQ